MEQIKIPDGYHSALNLHDTQIAIKTVKDFFQPVSYTHLIISCAGLGAPMRQPPSPAQEMIQKEHFFLPYVCAQLL